jgi:hypothetical protein
MKWEGDSYRITWKDFEIHTSYAPIGPLHIVRRGGKTVGYAKDLEEAKRACKEMAKQ